MSYNIVGELRWIDSDEANESSKSLERRDEAIALFANSLLKRTLSESFVGVKMTEGGSIGKVPDCIYTILNAIDFVLM